MVIVAGLCQEPERRSMAAPTLRACLARDPVRLVDALAERSLHSDPVLWEELTLHDRRIEVSIAIVGIGYAYTRLPPDSLAGMDAGALLEHVRLRITRKLLELYADEIEELDAELEKIQASLAKTIAENEAKLPPHLRRQPPAPAPEPAAIANDPFPPDDLGDVPAEVQQRRLGF